MTSRTRTSVDRPAVGRSYLVFAVAILMLISTLKVADRELLAPLHEPVSQELGLNDLRFGAIRSTTNVALIVRSILFGLLADRWRRRDVVALGVLCWSSITWATGQVQSFLQLLLARTLRIRTALLVYLLDGCQGATWWAFSFWAPAYLLRAGIAPDPDTAALALLPAIVGFVVGTLLGGWLIDRLRRRTERSAIWVSLISMTGALAMSIVVFALRELTGVLVAGFFLGLFGYMIMPAINVMLYDVVPPETRASATAADAVILSAFSALTAFGIGAVSHVVGMQQGLAVGNLRSGFQGAVFSLVLLRVAPADMRALRDHVSQRAVADAGGTGESNGS